MINVNSLHLAEQKFFLAGGSPKSLLRLLTYKSYHVRTLCRGHNHPGKNFVPGRIIFKDYHLIWWANRVG